LFFDRLSQLGLDPQEGHHAAVHRLVEHLVAAAAGRLGPVHRRVGVAQDLFRSLIARVGERHPDAGRGEDLATADQELLADQILDALGHPGRVARALDVVEEDHELVSTETGHRVARPQELGQTTSELDEQFVTDAVSE